MLLRFLLPVAVVFACQALCHSIIAKADIAMNVGAEGTNFNGSWTLGYQFFTDVDVDVLSLGFFDSGADGLSSAHDVGIWDTAGNLLVMANVDNTDPLTGKFRYTSIAPIQLSAGTNYIIGGFDYTSDAAIRNDLGVDATVHPDINIVSGRWTNGSSLSFPGNNISDPNIYYNTVSFEFSQVNAVPEPAGFAAVLVLLMVGCCRRTNRTRRI